MKRTPSPVFPSGSPATLTPMKLPWITFRLGLCLRDRMPSPVLPAMTLRASGVVPPIVLRRCGAEWVLSLSTPQRPDCPEQRRHPAGVGADEVALDQVVRVAVPMPAWHADTGIVVARDDVAAAAAVPPIVLSDAVGRSASTEPAGPEPRDGSCR